MSSIKERISFYIDSQDITKYRLYKLTGITRGVMDNKGGMSEENIAKFLVYFKKVNPQWLLTGEGSMLKEKVNLWDQHQAETKKANLEHEKKQCQNCMILERIIKDKEEIINLQRELLKKCND